MQTLRRGQLGEMAGQGVAQEEQSWLINTAQGLYAEVPKFTLASPCQADKMNSFPGEKELQDFSSTQVCAMLEKVFK